VTDALRGPSAAAVPTSADRAIGLWLLGCAAMVLAMAVIGAITRLTESGLSIMEWAPVTGILPPLGRAEWERLFALYREIPEYRLDNPGMTLAEFKAIFWWEYLHRLWGRLIGLAYALPLAWLLVTGRLRPGLRGHLLAILALGALQGGIGWYMVASGFADRTDVSQYRLAVHLVTALVIYGYLLWIAFRLLAPDGAAGAGPGEGASRAGLLTLLALIAVTIASGGLVAGLDAGLVYNSFPLMGGRLVPAGYGALSPWPLNWFENAAAVQFNHRLLAVASVGLAVALWLRSLRRPLAARARAAMALVGLAALAQLALGIATLLLWVPVPLAAAHQAGAILLLTAVLWALHRVPRPGALTARRSAAGREPPGRPRPGDRSSA